MSHQTPPDHGLPTADDNTSLEKGLGADNDHATNDTSGNETDPSVVDWDGAEDPENPMNWPESKKWIAVGTVSVMSLVT